MSQSLTMSLSSRSKSIGKLLSMLQARSEGSGLRGIPTYSCEHCAYSASQQAQLVHQVTTRLVVSDFNLLWQHRRFKTTAAQRAGLATRPWT